MAAQNILQTGLGFMAVAILIGYPADETLANKTTFQRTTAAVNKGEKTGRAAKVNISVGHRKDHAVAHNRKIV